MEFNAEFDAVQHDMLLDRVEKWVGLSDNMLIWFKFFIQDKYYFVTVGNCTSQWTEVKCGLSQESVLGLPLLNLYNLYMIPLVTFLP